MFAQHQQPIELSIRALVLTSCLLAYQGVALGKHLKSLERNSTAGLADRQFVSENDAHELAMKSLGEAEKLRAEWKEQSIREAIKKYTEATAYWRSLGSQREAAQALEDAGELHFVLSEYYEALDSYRGALVIRQSLKDKLGIIEVLDRIGYTFAYLGQNQNALEYLARAQIQLVKLRPVTGDAKRMSKEAQLLNSFGEVYYSLSDVKKALDSFSRALRLWKIVGDRRGEALASLNMGYMYHNFGDLRGAQDYYDQSLSLWTAAGDKRGEALTRTAMGGIQSFLGEQQRALDLHNEALSLFRFIGDRQGEAATLNGIGTAYEGLNKPQEALDNYDRAAGLYHAIGNRDYEALAKFYMGAVQRTLGSTERALGYYNESLSLLRSVGDRRIETYVLRDLATMYRSSGQTQKALSQYQVVLKLYNRFEDKRGQANTLNSIGDIYIHSSSDQTRRALALYKQALALVKESQDRGAEIATLSKLARAERDVGNISQALSQIDDSIRLIESLRTKIAEPDLRASYFASVHQNYEQYIDLLMNMNRLHPSEEFAEAALYASERSRARSLIEMLAEARVELRRGADSALVQRADVLERSLDAKAEYQMRVLSGVHSKDDRDEIDKEIRELERQYDQVQSRIREQSPLYLTLSEPRLLRLRDIQAELKDDSLLLEYALGEERSCLWAITSNSFTSYELPGRATLETEAREVYSLLTARQPQKDETQLKHDERVAKSDPLYWSRVSKLSQMLLDPVATQLGKRRLIIVADGALQYIPFETLPIDSQSRNAKASTLTNQGLAETMPTLVTEHEVVYLQSASMLAALQREKELPESRQKEIVILADPVFTQDDPRVPPKARQTASPGIPETTELRRSLRDIDGQNGEVNFSRLLSTLQEAKMIVKAAPRGSTEVITGFQANKPSAMTAALGQARILHFATHGIINDEHPELSGIVLSLVDQQGNARSGFLRLNDIYKLNLKSDLVVLSACRSGLGKQLNGEGFVGLTRGFMSAGSRSVIASLWKVDDEATAELMGHFYDAMLRQGLPPAAALQEAKQAMQSDPNWHHPYYWAGFVLQGEYRERITVEGSSTANIMIILALGMGLAVSGFFVLRRMTRRQS